MKHKIYLAYGSNLNPEQMSRRCSTARLIGAAELNGCRLVFRGADGAAVANAEPAKNCSVPVLLWHITPNDEAALDRYEGYPRLYRKENLTVKMNGEVITAMAYVMNIDGRPIGAPSCYYYSVILEGYRSAGFDEEVLRDAADFSAEGHGDDK